MTVESAPKVYVAPSGIHGEGVFAAVDIAAGELIFAIDESNVVPEGADIAAIQREHRNHCDYLADGRVVIIAPTDGLREPLVRPEYIQENDRSSEVPDREA